jgi:hypothetical protein
VPESFLINMPRTNTMHLPTQWPAARLASRVCRYAVSAAGMAVAAQALADMPPATRTASEQTLASFYPTPDKRAFVGLSDHGWPATAAIVLDRDGKILLLARHGEARPHPGRHGEGLPGRHRQAAGLGVEAWRQPLGAAAKRSR